MNKDQHTYAIITRYLSGKSDEQERQAFEARLATDEALREYLGEHQAANNLIIQAEQFKIKQELQSIHGQEASKSNSGLLWGLLALGIIAAATFFFWPTDSNESVLSEQDTSRQAMSTETLQEHSENQTLHEAVEQGAETDLVSTPALRNTNPPPDPTGPQTERGGPMDSLVPGQLREVATDLRVAEHKPEIPQGTEPLESAPFAEDCEPYDIALNYVTWPSCEGKRDGAIQVITSSIAEYKRYLINGTEAQSEPYFEKLSSSYYELQLVDKHGCISRPQSIYVPSMVCDIVLRPSEGLYWDIDISYFEGERVELEIYSTQTGALVYKQPLTSYEVHSWDGRSSSGETLGMGAYTYLLHEGDQYRQGIITILR